MNQDTPLAERSLAAFKAARKKSKMSQVQLSKASGLVQQNISRMESGAHGNVSLETLERLAKAMGYWIDIVYRKRR